jgi:xanthine dehydrogenase molybdopterin-binding subunit B
MAMTVQVDVLTGATEVLQTDILFDCGISLNPDVDIGTLTRPQTLAQST